MQEKVQVALAMSRPATVYLLDEPISGVDPAARQVILDDWCATCPLPQCDGREPRLPRAMPLGFVPVLATAVLLWRTVVTWNRTVSLA